MKYHRSMIITAAVMMAASSCENRSTEEFISVKVKQVEQVAGYTYLLVKSKGPVYWVAVPSMEASEGDSYYYQGGMVMQDFHSKELDKTFKEVLFLDALWTEVPTSEEAGGQTGGSAMGGSAMGGASMGSGNPHASQDATPGSKTPIAKSDIAVEACDGCISIAELYADPESYEGKNVRLKGDVVKFNPAIMKLNWAHIQDGTEYSGKFDLTLTSQESFEVGAIVTVEGVLALNKDFGYGYSYELLMEKAKAVE